MSVVHVLQNSTAKDSHLWKPLRYLTYFAVKFNFNFSAIHIDGKFNRGPDCLSRFRLKAFKQLYPYAEEEPTEVDLNLFRNLLMTLDVFDNSGLTGSTQLSYSSGQHAFLSFCMQFGIYNEDLGLLPASEIAILRFIQGVPKNVNNFNDL